MEHWSGWLWFFFGGWGLPFTAYVVLQVLALRRVHRLPRWIVLLPVLPMAIVVAATIWLLAHDSNLWPMILIFAGPLAALYLVVVWLLDSRRSAAGANRTPAA